MLAVPPPLPHIVLVDDDAALRTALAFSLELDGFAVDTCPDAEHLLERPLPARGTCLVIDLNLPGMSGLEALAVLRKRGVRLPALLITSHPRASVREAAAAVEARIVEKPLLGDNLVAAIRLALATG